MRIGVCLSGGGIKGAAHIGVLKALEEEKIEISYLSGCSSGSIVAILYACGYNTDEIFNIFKEYCSHIRDYNIKEIFTNIITGKMKITGFMKGKKLENLIRKYCEQKGINKIEQIKMNLVIPTVDLITGEVIYFTNCDLNIKNMNEKDSIKKTGFDDKPTYIYGGDIADVVRASCSFPVIFEPKKIGKWVLVDGGVREVLPTKVLKQMGADKIIAVAFDTNKENERCTNNIIDIMFQTFDILSHQAAFSSYKFVDVLLKPRLPKVSLFECNKEEFIYKQGYLEAKRNKEINTINIDDS